jgi:hypothetical protein
MNVLDFIIDYKTERMNQMQATFSTYTRPIFLVLFGISGSTKTIFNMWF